MENSNPVWCNNTQCDYYRMGECTYDGGIKVVPDPESNADCPVCEPCWFEWE